MNQPYNPSVYGKVRFEWIGESWQLFANQAGTWIGTTLLYLLISIGVAVAVGLPLGVFNSYRSGAMSHPFTVPATGASPFAASHSDPVGQLIYDAVSIVVTAFFYSGLFRMANKQVRGEPIGIGDLFAGGSTFLPMLGFAIVFALMQVVGMVVFCVGWIVVLALFWPAYSLIAEGVGFSDALSRSLEGMKRDWLMAALYVIVFGLLMSASAIPCGLGLFITIPMMFLSTSLAVRDMIGMPGAALGAPGYYSGQTAPGVWPPAPQNPAPGPGAYPYDAQPPAPNPYAQPPGSSGWTPGTGQADNTGAYNTPPQENPPASDAPPNGGQPGQNPPGGWPPTQ